jgi:fructoselysine-6-P-deglycase FrlB-like protein
VSEIAREIASQPSSWREAARRGAALAELLPSPDARVGVVGCGTSLYVAQAYAALRESRSTPTRRQRRHSSADGTR